MKKGVEMTAKKVIVIAPDLMLRVDRVSLELRGILLGPGAEIGPCSGDK